MNQPLIKKDLRIQADQQVQSSFLIERFNIPPTSCRKLVIDIIPSSRDLELDCLLIYDSHSNVRAQYRHVRGPKHIVIGEEEIESSTGTVPGPLPTGEWVMVMRSHSQALEPFCAYRYEITVQVQEALVGDQEN